MIGSRYESSRDIKFLCQPATSFLYPRKNSNILFFTILMILLAACSSPTPTIVVAQPIIPEFINHPRPDITVDMTVFELATGITMKRLHFEKYEKGPLADFDCDVSSGRPYDLIGALDPAFPIAYCTTQGENISSNIEWSSVESYYYNPNGNAFYIDGCMFSTYVRYLIYRDDHYELIESEDEFREIYAPIESPEEALSYVLAVTGLFAMYDLEYDPDLEYFVDVIEDSHVETVEDGYVVHLFHEKFCSCGPHPISKVDFYITPNGKIRQLCREEIFKNPAEDGMCTD